jgi:protein tyrosine/serine phosphatase
MLVVVIGLGVGGFAYQRASRLPRRFAPVVEGQLYRSGGVTPAQLERLYRDHGIRRVVCLLNPDAPETQAERQAAERLGIEWQNVPLPGNGASTPEQRRQILALLDDASPSRATLVHCAAGTHRTGLAIGLYRLHRQGWTLEQVLSEMRTFGFENGAGHENLLQALREEAAAAASASLSELHP